MPDLGNVYIFNATPNTMTLILNNSVLVSSLAGIRVASRYQPVLHETQRNPAPGDPGNATFGGTNTLIVSFPGGGSQTYPVDIDPNQIQISNDLQLYIYFNEVVLVSPSGSAQPSGQAVVIPGRPTDNSVLEQILG